MTFLETTPISFPGLGIGAFNPPDGITIFGFEIKFYGMIIAFGVLLAVIYGMRRRRHFGLSEDDLINGLLIALPCAIIGARAYYVIFEWEHYFGPGIPWTKCLAIRDGGLAIYGGVIGAVLSLIVFCYTSRRRRALLLPAFDIASLGLLIGQSLGRWGNFFNREAHGGLTESFLRMGLLENGQWNYYHPTFLYESLWNAAGFVLLHFWSKKHQKFDGEIFLGYLAWYGLGRAFIEGLRTDSLYIGDTGLRVSQVLAGVTCLISLAIFLWVRLKVKPDPKKRLANRVAAEATAAPEIAPEE